VLNDDGTFWISDEYGPYVYHFSRSGKMLQAIRPNDAIITMRNGSESFSADSPPHYINNGAGNDVSPADNPTGATTTKASKASPSPATARTSTSSSRPPPTRKAA
jgi:hypothetical protein